MGATAEHATGPRERGWPRRRSGCTPHFRGCSPANGIRPPRSATERPRDREAEERHASLTASFNGERASNGQQIMLRTARDRERAAADRPRATNYRAEAARDCEDAAADRLEAAEDRARATNDRDTAALDELTGARRRGPGLAELQREIDRARRTTGRLVLAYVDVDGLKALNGAKSHAAGDVMFRVLAVGRHDRGCAATVQRHRHRAGCGRPEFDNGLFCRAGSR